MGVYLVTLVAIMLAVQGCGMLVVKKTKPAGSFHGIPFYVKTARCKHQVVRLEPYFVFSLTTKDGDKVLSTESTTLSFTQFNSPDAVNLRSSLAGKGSAPGIAIRGLWDKVRAMHYEPHIPESQISANDWFIVSDTVSSFVYVDYQHPYTLNARRPLIGNVQVSAKLGDDGTLSEASGQSEDKTLSTLLSLIPTTDLIKSAAGIAGFDSGTTVTVELATEEKAVKFTRTYLLNDIFPPCIVDSDTRKEPTTAEELKAHPYDLAVEEAAADRKEADGNTIKVNGSIQLPKANDSKPKETKPGGPSDKK